MLPRIALACVYTLFVVVLLATWSLERPSADWARVITSVPIARWLVMLIPLYWGWVAFHLGASWARKLGLAASAVLFVACLVFVVNQDMAAGPPCLWHSGNCGSRWF